MKINLVLLLCLVSLMALAACFQAPNQEPTPTQGSVGEQSEQEFWKPGPPLKGGELSYAPSSSAEATRLKNGQRVTVAGETVWLSVALVGDHRWVRYGKPTVQVEDTTIVVTVPTELDTRPHIENYVESTYQSEPVEVQGLKGEYQVVVGGETVNTLVFE